MTAILDAFSFPPEAYLNKVIFKKLISDNTDLDVTDKKALRDDIDKIRLLYSLKPDTTHIESYVDHDIEYLEIAVLQIDLSHPDRMERIAKFINKAIPYPLILIFHHDNDVAITTAHKRINQADKSKMVVKDIYHTAFFDSDNANNIHKEFLKSLAFSDLSFVNLYAFYQDIVGRIIALNAAIRVGQYKAFDLETAEDKQQKLKTIQTLEGDITSLRARLKKENQFNQKMELNIQIKQKQKQIKEIEKAL